MTHNQSLLVPELSALRVMTLVCDPTRARKLNAWLADMGITRMEHASSLEVATRHLHDFTFDIVVAEIHSDSHEALVLPATLRAIRAASLPSQCSRVLWWGEYSPPVFRSYGNSWLGLKPWVTDEREFAQVGGLTLSALESHTRFARQHGIHIEIARSAGLPGLRDALGLLMKIDPAKAEVCAVADVPTDEEIVDALVTGSGLHVAFQSQYDLQTRSIVGAEALVRWRHLKLGDISPAQFLPSVQRLGLDLVLFGFVRGHAVNVLRELAAQHAEVPIAVNASTQTICTAEFAQRLTDDVRDANLSPHLLRIELTEDMPVEDSLALSTALNMLRANGFSVSLDDFGKGSATLSMLASMPFDEVKIDATFVRGIESRSACRGIVATAVELARLLNLNIVAEGIENEASVALLRRLGCRTGQGYALGRPMSARNFIHSLVGSGPR